MSDPSDLVILVVESDDKELAEIRKSLNELGVDRIEHVDSYSDALKTINDSPDIDIVITDFDIEYGKALGLALCADLKVKNPTMYFILISKRLSYSIILDSLPVADDILDNSIDSEIQERMRKWIDLARYRNEVKEIFYGRRKK